VTYAWRRRHLVSIVHDARVLPGGVLHLRFQRPTLQGGRRFQFRTGQWVRINCPALSRLEWHPFTISSPTSDPLLSLHIKAAGDWTSALHRLIANAQHESGRARESNAIDSNGPDGQNHAGSEWPEFYLEGPFGAPAQDFDQYPIILLAAAGVGATPMVSIARELVRTASIAASAVGADSNNSCVSNTRKAYFHWVIRQHAAAQTWFEELIREVAEADAGHLLDINFWYTGGGNRKEMRTTLLQLAQDVARSSKDLDIFAGSLATEPVTVHFGRPDWGEEFERILEEAEAEEANGKEWKGPRKVGVFCCGPAVMERELRQLCLEYSTNGLLKFELRAESF
jgi:respiratory burst oxidase